MTGRRFEAPDGEAEDEDATRAKLSKLIEGPGQVFEYLYDFGDDWRHRIEVIADAVAADPGWIPYLVDGARRGPPEDCGGPGRYMDLVAASRIPYEDLEEEDRAIIDWAGRNFDPEEFSPAQARNALLLSAAWGSLRRRR